MPYSVAGQLRPPALVPLSVPVVADTVLITDWQGDNFVVHNPASTPWL